MFGISYKKVGGLRFLRIGRIRIQVSVAKSVLSDEEKAIARQRKARDRRMTRFWVRYGKAEHFGKTRAIMAQVNASYVRAI